MPQPINEGDIIELTLEGSVEQQPWALVRHYIAQTVATPQGLLDAIITLWVNSLIPQWATMVTDLTVF